MTGQRSGGIVRAPGQLRSEFAALRRRRALFRLADEGPSALCMTSDPDTYVVAAWYEDDGYRGEPLRARAVVVHRSGRHSAVPFSGSTPGDLLDLMEAVCAEADDALAS